MTRSEKERIAEVLEFLKTTKAINSYEIDDMNFVIKISTNEKDERDIEFLKFKIIVVATVVNETFENKLVVEIID